MEIQEITSLVGSVGWPIVSSLLLMWYVNQINLRWTNERDIERQAHSKEMEAITSAINANTVVLEALKEKIGE